MEGENFDEIRQFPLLTTLPKPKTASSSREISNEQNGGTPHRKHKTIKAALPRAVNDTKILPGLLKTSKPSLVKNNSVKKNNSNSNSIFVGFNATHVHLDTSSPLLPPPSASFSFSAEDPLATGAGVGQVTMNTLMLNNQATLPIKNKQQLKQDDALAQLRSYTSLMDEFSLHNFMIWNGVALRDTPEFQSYHRSYKNQWSYVETVIIQLEKLMKDNCIKLAIISGSKVIHYSLLNLPYLQLYQLMDCISNADQIRPQLSSFSGDSQDQILRATVKIQTLGRRWFAIYRYKNLKKRLVAAIVIQSVIRRYVQRCRTHSLQQQLMKQSEFLWKDNFNSLFKLYNSSLGPPGQGTVPGTVPGTGAGTGAGTGGTRYLLLLIPTISASEFIRLNMTHLLGLQNSLISSLSLLADPRIDLIYVTPVAFGTVEKTYINKFLALMGISTVPNRLKFIVPDLTSHLPPTLPVSHMLWYSSATLRKLKAIIKLHSANVLYATATHTHNQHTASASASASAGNSSKSSPIRPSPSPAAPPSLAATPAPALPPLPSPGLGLNTSTREQSLPSTAASASVPKCSVLMFSSEVTWIEKRIAIFLGINMMSPEPIVATEFSSLSQSKRLFMESNMNIPIGAHDIFSEEDLLIALTRLISSNLSISRWVIRLNVDHNHESTVLLDTAKLPIVAGLKVEQQMLMNSSGAGGGGGGGGAGGEGDTECWYERHVQLNARKRILHQLKDMISSSSSALPSSGAPGGGPLLTLCRDDLYPSWAHYLPFLNRIGVVIEAEPPLLQGRVESYCFISPVGGIHIQTGAQIVHDEAYQQQGILFPQTLIHPKALEGAVRAIGLKLYDSYGVMGYLSVSFVVYRDAYDSLTRLWATGLRFGMSSAYGAIGTLAQLTNPFNSMLMSEHPLLPQTVEGRCCVHLPTVIHPPLSSSRDDVFFKLCKMNGISYDPHRRTGVLFFMVDSLVGGVLSLLIIADTKLKAMECAIQVLTFISKNFGKAESREQIKDWSYLTNILRSLKVTLKKEIARAKDPSATSATTTSHL